MDSWDWQDTDDVIYKTERSKDQPVEASTAEPEGDPMAFTPSDNPNDPYAIPGQLHMSPRDFKAFMEACDVTPCPACKGSGYVSTEAAATPSLGEAEAERENAARLCEDLLTFTEDHTQTDINGCAWCKALEDAAAEIRSGKRAFETKSASPQPPSGKEK